MAAPTPPSPWVETWHHYCVTYAAEEHPKEKDRYLPGNVTLYVDGRKEGFWKNATVNTSLGSPLYIGADIKGSKTLDGAVDEVYVYDKALDAWQVEVLHGILSPPPTAGPSAAPTPVPSPLPSVSPTLTSAPTDHEYQDNLVAYYPMTHGKLDDAHDHGSYESGFHGKAMEARATWSSLRTTMVAADLRQTEARDGPEGDAVALNNSKHIELPDNVTRSISGDRPRTVCLWARIDKWKNKARIFEYGRKAPQGELFGLRTWNVPGEFAVEVPWNVRNHWDNRHVNLSTNVSITRRRRHRRRLDGTDTDSRFRITPERSSASGPHECRLDGLQVQLAERPMLVAAPTPQSPWVATWHHYCVTYAAEPHPKERDRYLPGNVTLYVDGRKEGFWKNATVNTSLGSPLYIGADIKGSKTLDGAVDEVYVYDKALEAWQVEVLHGILSPPPTAGPSAAPTPVPSPLPSVSPTLTSAPTDHEYQDNLVAYYPMTHGKLDDAHASVGIPRQGMEARAT